MTTLRTKVVPRASRSRSDTGSNVRSFDRMYTWSSDASVESDVSLHQLAPYIGRMKTAMARSLLLRHTRPADTIVDPFCGCGVVPADIVPLSIRNGLAAALRS
jgi:hypothetical protein